MEMTDEQVCETVEKYGANREECARLNASLSCLRNVHMSGEQAQWDGRTDGQTDICCHSCSLLRLQPLARTRPGPL